MAEDSERKDSQHEANTGAEGLSDQNLGSNDTGNTGGARSLLDDDIETG